MVLFCSVYGAVGLHSLFWVWLFRAFSWALNRFKTPRPPPVSPCYCFAGGVKFPQGKGSAVIHRKKNDLIYKMWFRFTQIGSWSPRVSPHFVASEEWSSPKWEGSAVIHRMNNKLYKDATFRRSLGVVFFSIPYGSFLFKALVVARFVTTARFVTKAGYS